MKAMCRILAGWFFIILGIIGLFLPILQGGLFIIIGLLLLAPGNPSIQRLLAKLKKEYPHIFRKLKKEGKAD